MVLAVAMEFERVAGPVGLHVAEAAELTAGFDEVGLWICGGEVWQV